METRLNYSTRDINRNFRIKVAGNGLNTLVGVQGALQLVGDSLLNNMLDRAFNSLDDCCICKLRRGIKFSFYAK
jgi:hypothetical protein